MAGFKFDFSRLNAIYVDALLNERKTIVFEVTQGIGIFVFMLFFSEEDESKDQLFLFLARTNKMLALKMYGRHSKYEQERNMFSVFVTASNEADIKEELGISGGTSPFDLSLFLSALNNDIPQTLPVAALHEYCHKHSKAFRKPELGNAVDEAHKIHLIGPKNLAPGTTAREKTLRKLYIYVKAAPGVLEDFLTSLKASGKTLAWSANPAKENSDLRKMLCSL